MREHKKKWLFDKGKTSGARKRWSWGGDFADERNTKQFSDLEDAPKKSGMKTGRKYNNRLSFRPLRRFLKAKTGCNWNDVYSEIKERIPADIWETHHPEKYYVSIHVEILSDGSIVDIGGNPVTRYLISKNGKTSLYRYSHYYVHPETNLLCRLEVRSPGREGQPKLTKKEGKKKFAKYKTNRNKSKREYKESWQKNSEMAAEKMKEKKRQTKNDIQENIGNKK